MSVISSPQMHDIPIKLFDPICNIEKLSVGDWIDLRARETVCITAGDSAIVPLGIAMQIPEGYEAHIAPRSSTYKKWGVLLTNSVGVIDHSYCGNDDEWGASFHAVRDTTINKGDRVCQFRLIESMPKNISFKVVDSFINAVNRGGFGSTGHN